MILYKYLPSYLPVVIEKKEIRFTQPCYFNDPFEFKPVIEKILTDQLMDKYIEENWDNVLEDKLQSVKSLLYLIPKQEYSNFFKELKKQIKPYFKSLEPQLIEGFTLRIDELFKNNFGVLCLSSIWNSILMWGHYAESHKGFAIGFDSENKFFNQQRSEIDEFGIIKDVKYELERPKVSFGNSTSLEWFFTKNREWCYESEYRMLLPLFMSNTTFERNGEIIHLYEFPEDSIKEILIGSRASSELTSILKKEGNSLGVPVYRTFLDSNLYKINREFIT